MIKKFTFLICVAIVNCVPQGYNYHHTQQNSGLSIQSGQQLSTQSFASNQITNQPFGNVQHTQAPVNVPNDHHAFLHEALSTGGNYQTSNIPSYQPLNHNVAPIVTKDIYVHAAPEEPEEQYTQSQSPALPPRKHYRIVFIKAPTQNIKQQSIRLSQAPTEEKTIIYVLSKKDDPADIQAALQEIQPTQPSKPEVYFIKYKTQEEAAHAQKQIQAQYDSLGGSTHISDEGFAPVTSVVGSLNNHHGNTNAQSSYLPPAIKK